MFNPEIEYGPEEDALAALEAARAQGITSLKQLKRADKGGKVCPGSYALVHKYLPFAFS